MFAMSFCRREMRARSRRRSVSSLVSPGPRVPMPPPPATRPPACRDSDSPQPRSLGSMYCSWASSTWTLPSRLRACWAKMSRISAVRSMTLTCTTPSSRRSSRSEFSALARLPSSHTPISTTRSRRSARYSTSLTSCSSVESPATRRSACRSSRSMSPRSGCSSKTVLIVLRHRAYSSPDGATRRAGFHLVNTPAAPYVPRRGRFCPHRARTNLLSPPGSTFLWYRVYAVQASGRERSAGGQVPEGSLGGGARGGAIGDEALAGFGDVQHLALEFHETGLRMVHVLEHRPAHLDLVRRPHVGEQSP